MLATNFKDTCYALLTAAQCKNKKQLNITYKSLLNQTKNNIEHLTILAKVLKEKTYIKNSYQKLYILLYQDINTYITQNFPTKINF